MAIVCAHNATLTGTCGVGLAARFMADSGFHYGTQQLKGLQNYGGAKWRIAGFVNTVVCKEAYNILKEDCKIILQVPVRRNSNSGNPFFFCVYDTQAARGSRPRWVGKSRGAPKPQALIDWEATPPTPIDNSQHTWPWS